ncbi:MAG: hypothetical protein IPM53_01470 [Anaerolineaceae bacterium]|nr:hypothetical protein [Anaerolineaceae bacterium]
MKKFNRSNIGFTGALLSVAVIAFFTYDNILSYFFTGKDTLVWLVIGQIQEPGDVLTIFASPMQDMFYRPISALSHGLDYAVWGLDPFGHHLTNVILHSLVSILAFLLLYQLTSGRKWVAWLSATVFTLHPILVESVPSPVRRHDILVELFLVLTLLLFLKHRSSTGKKRYLVLSILCSILALGSKEIGVIVAPLILGYILIYSQQQTLRARFIAAVQASKFYFITGVLFLAWRTYILKGIGGYGRSLNTLEKIESLLEIPSNYFADLLFPVDFLVSLTNSARYLVMLAFLLAVLFVLALLLKFANQPRSYYSKQLKTYATPVSVLLVFGLTASLVLLFSYPFMAPTIDQIVERAYSADGFGFIAQAMKGRADVPLEHYTAMAQLNIARAGAWIFMLCAAGLIILWHGEQLKHFLSQTDDGNLIAFLLLWICLPLGVFIATFTFDHRYMYISVIPLSGILSLLVLNGFDALKKTWSAVKNHEQTMALSHAATQTASVAVFTSLITSFVVFSPLIHEYDEWDYSGQIADQFFTQFDEVMTDLPANAEIHVYDLPSKITSYETEVPHAKSVSYLGHAGIESWLELNHETYERKVILHEPAKLSAPPHELFLTLNSNKTVLSCRVGFLAESTSSDR